MFSDFLTEYLGEIVAVAESSGQNNVIRELFSLCELRYLGSDRIHNARRNIFSLLSFSDIVNHFRLCKDRTKRANRKHRSCSRHLKEFVDGNAQTVCHNLQEFPGSGGTFIIHQEVHNHTPFHEDHFCILSSHVDHRTVTLCQLPAASCVTGDFRDDIIRKIYGYTAVSGGHDSCVILLHVCPQLF